MDKTVAHAVYPSYGFTHFGSSDAQRRRYCVFDRLYLAVLSELNRLDT